MAGEKRLNSLWPRQDGRLFRDHILKRIFLNENVFVSIEIPIKSIFSIGSDNSLALTRRQAIIGTNAELTLPLP